MEGMKIIKWEFVEPCDWYGNSGQHIIKSDFRFDNVALGKSMHNTKVGEKYFSYNTLKEAQEAHKDS